MALPEISLPVEQTQYGNYIVVAWDIKDQSAEMSGFQGIDKAYINYLFHIRTDVEQIGASSRPDYYDYVLLRTTAGSIFQATTFGFVLL